LRHFGFAERTRGSHHIFSRDEIAEILNLQPKGGKAKAYQVKQVRAVLLKYNLVNDEDDTSGDDEPTTDDSQSANSEEGNAG
jgi:hypothetical protein